MKKSVFWDMALCSLVKIDRTVSIIYVMRFFLLTALMMEPVNTAETWSTSTTVNSSMSQKAAILV